MSGRYPKCGFCQRVYGGMPNALGMVDIVECRCAERKAAKAPAAPPEPADPVDVARLEWLTAVAACDSAAQRLLVTWRAYQSKVDGTAEKAAGGGT